LKELPEFDTFAAKHKGKINIVAVSVDMADKCDDAVKTVSDFWKKNDYTDVHMVFDHQANLARALGASGVPTTIFLDADGKEIGRVNGVLFWTDPKIKNVIQNIFA
jgi:thiol-disulfide isomerase/thioredoxin